ncbi:tellurite resistance TerB family protein [Actinomadura macrotermitis]|uniref:Co-chaperone DjlA N-terminal domain-containing protein n=1 Tax=Actinomadura macrotermitis TaxID=2585200 RepID=A0A7K0C047_9ACTN|nr:tellurium resistance protein [Actinomadura macrotermitis]MQY06807.1 hypothetical protein [Actinomadura macrotermitis]
MDVKELGSAWLLRKDWSFETEPTVHDKEQYGKALLTCAAGGGEISQEQREWVKGYFAAFGSPQELIETLDAYDGQESLESILSQSEAATACSRVLIYDAIRACSTDGKLEPGELARIRKANRLLGHDDQVVDDWVEYYQEEVRMQERRTKLMWPDISKRPY